MSLETLYSPQTYCCVSIGELVAIFFTYSKLHLQYSTVDGSLMGHVLDLTRFTWWNWRTLIGKLIDHNLLVPGVLAGYFFCVRMILLLGRTSAFGRGGEEKEKGNFFIYMQLT